MKGAVLKGLQFSYKINAIETILGTYIFNSKSVSELSGRPVLPSGGIPSQAKAQFQNCSLPNKSKHSRLNWPNYRRKDGAQKREEIDVEPTKALTQISRGETHQL